MYKSMSVHGTTPILFNVCLRLMRLEFNRQGYGLLNWKPITGLVAFVYICPACRFHSLRSVSQPGYIRSCTVLSCLPVAPSTAAFVEVLRLVITSISEDAYVAYLEECLGGSHAERAKFSHIPILIHNIKYRASANPVLQLY